MRSLARLYHPITGTPFQQDETYREVPACEALRPYIRCFWGSEFPLPARPGAGGIVIPDTCMDIIFHIDYAQNRINSSFCALDERSYRTPASIESGGLSATFAIRFYAWTTCLFAENSLRGASMCIFQLVHSSAGLSARCCPYCLRKPRWRVRFAPLKKCCLRFSALAERMRLF